MSSKSLTRGIEPVTVTLGKIRVAVSVYAPWPLLIRLASPVAQNRTDADLARRCIRGAELGLDCQRVQIDVHLRRQVQDTVETADVIVVPVAQDNRIRLGEIDSKGFGVMQEQIALARVKEDLLILCFEPDRHSVFGA